MISNEHIGCLEVKAFDIDNDNDIFATSIFDGKVVWYKNMGEGNFSEQLIISDNCPSPIKFDIADINDDGLWEMISIPLIRISVILEKTGR